MVSFKAISINLCWRRLQNTHEVPVNLKSKKSDANEMNTRLQTGQQANCTFTSGGLIRHTYVYLHIFFVVPFFIRCSLLQNSSPLVDIRTGDVYNDVYSILTLFQVMILIGSHPPVIRFILYRINHLYTPSHFFFYLLQFFIRVCSFLYLCSHFDFRFRVTAKLSD